MASNYDCKEADVDSDIEERSMHDEVFKTTAAKATAGVDDGAGRNGGDALVFLGKLIRHVETYMQEKIDAFLKANCRIMEGREDADLTYADIPCEVSTIQRSYISLIESELQPFLEENGLSHTEFYAMVEQCKEVSKDAAYMVNFMLMGAVDTKRFVELLCDRWCFYKREFKHMGKAAFQAEMGRGINSSNGNAGGDEEEEATRKIDKFSKK